MTHITESLLNEYLDDALDETARPAVAAHLETCTQCREALAELQLVFTALESVAAVPLAADLSQRVVAEIQARRRPSPWARLLTLVQVAAAIFMLIRLWPSIQFWLGSANQAINTALAAFEPQQLFAWQRLVEWATAAIQQAQATRPLLELAAEQWSLLIGLALVAWLAGNRLLLTVDVKPKR